MFREAKEIVLSLAGHLCRLAVSYGPPIGALYLLDQNGFLGAGRLAVIVPASILWVFGMWWLTSKWSDWGSIDEPRSGLGRFDPERAAIATGKQTPPKPMHRFRLLLAASLLVLASVTVTAGYYEFNDRYERCILKNMPGTPERAVSLVYDACRELSR